MSGKSRPRGEIEVKNISAEPLIKAFYKRFEDQILAYTDTMKINTPAEFRRWIISLKELKEIGFLKKVKPQEDKFSILDFIDEFEKCVRGEGKNPESDLTLKVLEKYIFGEAVFEKFQGISYEFKDNDGDENDYYEWAVITVEPGAQPTNLRAFVDKFGKHITHRINKFLPEHSHLKGSVSQKKKEIIEMVEIISERRKQGVKFSKICDELRDKGYKRPTETYARNLILRAKKKM